MKLGFIEMLSKAIKMYWCMVFTKNLVQEPNVVQVLKLKISRVVFLKAES